MKHNSRYRLKLINNSINIRMIPTFVSHSCYFVLQTSVRLKFDYHHHAWH